MNRIGNALFASALALGLANTGAQALMNKMVGGAPMYPSKTSSRTPSTRRTTPRWSRP